MADTVNVNFCMEKNVNVHPASIGGMYVHVINDVCPFYHINNFMGKDKWIALLNRLVSR